MVDFVLCSSPKLMKTKRKKWYKNYLMDSTHSMLFKKVKKMEQEQERKRNRCIMPTWMILDFFFSFFFLLLKSFDPWSLLYMIPNMGVVKSCYTYFHYIYRERFLFFFYNDTWSLIVPLFIYIFVNFPICFWNRSNTLIK